MANVEDNSNNQDTGVKYGELLILGTNGSVGCGRRRNKLALYKRPKPNGLKPSKSYILNQPLSDPVNKTRSCNGDHSISYVLSKNQAIVVEYLPDENTDMFQIGRLSEPSIDFVVSNTVARRINRHKNDNNTISRFACRILADRNNPKICRIYAGGFDTSRNIWVGEKAIKWKEGDEIDGLTTNGVLISQPVGIFTSGHAQLDSWAEVSLCGNIYSMRGGSRCAQRRGVPLQQVSNILQDGSLIDLCGVTLLWRSAHALADSLTKTQLQLLFHKVNVPRPNLKTKTLVIPRKLGQSKGTVEPYVYLNCGHVQGLDQSQTKIHCSVCFKSGPYLKLSMGSETRFYVDCAPLGAPIFFAFIPCGHIATQRTVKYWASVPIPHGTCCFDAFCPFCAIPIEGHPGYVQLIFT